MKQSPQNIEKMQDELDIREKIESNLTKIWIETR